MALRLSGQTFFLVSFVSQFQKKLGYKENNTKYTGLPGKPWNHVKILF